MKRVRRIGLGLLAPALVAGALAWYTWAYIQIDPAVVRLLLEAGAEVNAKNNRFPVALPFARRHFSSLTDEHEKEAAKEIISLLKRAGAKE